MSEVAMDAAGRLLRQLASSARGPKKQGVFALWLVVRVATDLAEIRPSDRAHRRRVQALERRLSSLTLPPPFRRALQGTLEALRSGKADEAARGLVELSTPTRESLGPEIAECVHSAALEVRRRVAAAPPKN